MPNQPTDRECPGCQGCRYAALDVSARNLCQGTGRIPTDDGIGEYYARKERERKVAWAHRANVKDALAAAIAADDLDAIEELEAALRRAERAYELAAYVGD